MSSKDAAKTAFRTPIGNFYYAVMPFSLKNSRAIYQRDMTAIFHDIMHKKIEDFMDNIVVKSKTRGDHLAILRKVFERCWLYELRMNPLMDQASSLNSQHATKHLHHNKKQHKR